MTLVSTKVPSIRKSPWGYGGFLGSLAHTTVKTTTSPTTYYLENTSSLPVVVSLNASALGNFKIELFLNCTFTGSTPVAGANLNLAYSSDVLNSPFRIFEAATSVTLGTADWTWGGSTSSPLQIFGKNSLTGAFLVLAGNEKAAVTVTATSSGSDTDISPADWDMEALDIYSWANYNGTPTVKVKASGAPGGTGLRVLNLSSTVSPSWARPQIIPTFTLGKTYTISMWMRGSVWVDGDGGNNQGTTAYFYLPDNTTFNASYALISKLDDGWRFKTKTLSPVSGSESTFWMNCVKALGSLGTNTYAEFDEIKVLELADPDPINLNFSHTLWDGSLFGDV